MAPPLRHQLYCFRDSRPHRLSLIGDSAHANERAGKLAGTQLAQRKADMLLVRRSDAALVFPRRAIKGGIVSSVALHCVLSCIALY